METRHSVFPGEKKLGGKFQTQTFLSKSLVSIWVTSQLLCVYASTHPFLTLKVEEGWWEGLLNGKTGMFPSNFTKEVLAESDSPSVDTPNSQEELHGARTSESSHHHQLRAVSVTSGLSLSFFAACV